MIYDGCSSNEKYVSQCGAGKWVMSRPRPYLHTCAALSNLWVLGDMDVVVRARARAHATAARPRHEYDRTNTTANAVVYAAVAVTAIRAE